METLERFFEIRQRNSTIGREVRGGVTTFLTMAYILFVNPLILKSAGVPYPQAITCTALAAGVCCILMGVFANFPIALASGMGLNAVVAIQVTQAAGSWQAAMGLIVLDGLVTLVLVIAGLREAIMNAIPRDLRLAIGAGIGLFIAFIGLVNTGLVVPGPNPHAPVAPGSLHDRSTQAAFVGLILMAILVARKITGSIILGIIATTILAYVARVKQWPGEFPRPSIAGLAFHANVKAALRWDLMPLLFAVIMVDFFDTLGTATAIAEEGKLMDERGRIPRIRRILMIDSISASIGGLLGASSVTSYIESAAGVAEGARTGLHSVVVGILFLIAMFATPLAALVPEQATAPALIIVGYLMMTQVAEVDFKHLDNSIPAFVTMLTIPLTYSIAHGIGYGFITYVLIKLLSGKPREAHVLMYVAAAAFAALFLSGRG